MTRKATVKKAATKKAATKKKAEATAAEGAKLRVRFEDGSGVCFQGMNPQQAMQQGATLGKGKVTHCEDAATDKVVAYPE